MRFRQLNQKLNNQISDALKISEKTVPIESTVQALESTKSSLNPDIHSKDIAEIDKVLEKIKGREIKEHVPTGNEQNLVEVGTGQMPG